ncbi:uncharacterized protein LOC126770861 isoform X2 [Nymphalis io]|uniref:uncharacterized protein LOC126770861 isoform X2 n=1 Tax=Inachis io TaxID=171585 RepID=UPI0021679D4C|nr:uncharacterized protein LOC126770861 isoform X2 [Nymphalis io]
MDFVNSLDLDSANDKCNRVRSWYLYEQYRSLEQNQLDAAQRLKNKSYQDKILKQELSERRARRRLCDQFGLCQSESKLDRSVRSVPSNVYLNDDDLFESFSELHDEYELENYEDNNSHDSETSNEIEDFTSVANIKEANTANLNDVAENVKIDKVDNDIREELETVKKNIAENINLQLETVKENIKCLEKYAKFDDEAEISDVDDVTINIPRESDVNYLTNYKLKNIKDDNSVLKVWANFVDFAYKMIHLNHGNCYYEYSSQILTAVLACDVLFRGVSRIYLRFTDKL